MAFTRRNLLVAASGLTMGCASPRTPRLEPAPRIRAVAFDAFVLFDPSPFTRELEMKFPGRGLALAASYRTRLFEYGWLRALGGRYQDFWAVSEDALEATAEAEGLDLTPALRASLLEVWGALPPWPDAVEGVRWLSRQGVELALLSNWSPRMIDAALVRSGLRDLVRPLSTDLARSYKPDPRAYALAVDAFRMRPPEILFVAFAGWDAAGGSWFGFPTVWMNRTDAPPDRLDLEEVATAKSFDDLRAAIRRATG